MSKEGIPIIGDSPSIQTVIRSIKRYATTQATVLIRGESGTGKALVARTIHDTSPRRAKPFIAFKPVPSTDVELDLFGFESDVATGVERHVGRIEAANGGTLFLHEIGDLSLATQTKLLRVLKERKLESVDGGKPIDIRFLAATNKDLMREENWFIRRFFYRLYPNVVAIHMPALREIRSDIPLLATHFLRKYTTEIGRDIQGFSQDALTALATYHWPGNVRELQNVISRAVSVSKGEVIRADDLNMGFYDDPDEESGSLVTK